MQNPEELNAKLLERSLEQHETARANFFRDLKIAAVALLVFQFFVFFRFASLSDQLLELQPKLKQAETDERALVDVQTSLAAFKATLKTGTDKLADSLLQVPQNIRDQLAKLDVELRDFRERPITAPRIQAMNVQSNMAASASRAIGGFLGNVASSEQQTLHETKQDEPAYQQSVIRIVESQIIEPVFRRLNEQAKTLLTQPLARGLADLRNQSAALTTLRKTGAAVDGWLTNAERVVTLAGNLKFDPPAKSDWWTSARSKADYASSAQLDTRRIADEAKTALSTQDNDLAILAKKMEATVADLQQQEQKLEVESERLQANANSIQGLIDGYAKPLAAVALQPKELVIFYPVVLAAVITMFAVRQLLLRRRAAALASVYREIGISNDVLQLYFTELSASGTDPSRRPYFWARSRRRLPELLWVVPAGLAVTSFGWILASKSLGGEAPRLLYLCSGLVLAAACVFLVLSSRESNRATLVHSN